MYIALDCEMGGIDLKYSLLTVYFRVLNNEFEFVDDLYLPLKPDNGDYVLTARGMEVNQINLIEHDKIAITYTDGKDVLRKWMYGLSQMPGYQRMDPLGHQVDGDVRHIWDKLMAREKWESYVSYRKIDTSSTAKFLRDRKAIPSETSGPEGVSGSLSSLAEFFGVKPEGQLHHAKTDTLLTIEVYKKMLKVKIPNE
jgi:hypothetical protein